MAATDHVGDPDQSGPFPAGLPFFRTRPRPLGRWTRAELHRKPGGWPTALWPPFGEFGSDDPETWLLQRPDPAKETGRPDTGW